jgi:ABC-type multidrug transport system fused ATPase/permease subunit
MNFGPSLADLVNVWSTLETSLAAVERVKIFAEETPTELAEAPVQLEQEWPQAGNIQFQDVSLRYRSAVAHTPVRHPVELTLKMLT